MADDVVGSARIVIDPDTRDFEPTLRRDVERAASSAGRTLVSRADAIGTEFGSRLGSAVNVTLQRGLLVGAAGVAAAVGITLVKGFQRFTTIEDSTKSLTLLLGSATNAANLLGDVLKTVEGTPFALDQFVSAARNLVAASIPAERIPRILTAIGDAAAAAGGSADDVNNVVNSIARLATGAAASLGPIRELEVKGVPALRILANKAGVSADAMAKAISKGSVDSKQAIDDLVEGIINGTEGINGATVAFGGAAKGVGDTVSGAFGNMQTAIARAGANIIKVFAESGEGGKGLVRIINGIRNTIDVVGKEAVETAESLVGTKGFGRVLAFFDDLPTRVKESLDAFDEESVAAGFKRLFRGITFDLGDFIGGIVRQIERLPTEKISAALTVLIVRSIGALPAAIPDIVAAVIEVAPEIIRGVVEGFIQAARDDPLNTALFLVALGLPAVGPAIAAFFGALPFGFLIKPLLEGLTKAIRIGVGALASKVLIPALARIVIPSGAFTGVFSIVKMGAVSAASGLGTSIMGALTGAVSGPAIAVALGAALGIGIHQLIEQFTPGINRVLESFGAILFTFFVETLPRFFTDTLPQTLGGIGLAIVDFFTQLPGKTIKVLQSFVGAIFGFIAGIDWEQVGFTVTTAILNVFLGAPKLFITAIVTWGPAILGAIVMAFEATLSFFEALPGRIGGFFTMIIPLLVDIAGRALSAVAGAVVNGAEATLGFFRDLPGRIGGFFVNVIPIVVGIAGRALAGMAEAVVSGGAAVLGWFRDLPGRIAGFIGELVSVGFDIGRSIVDGIVRGLRNAGGAIRDVLVELAKGAWKAVKKFLHIDSPSSLFRDTVGVPIVEGIVAGLELRRASLDELMRRMSRDAVEAMRQFGQLDGTRINATISARSSDAETASVPRAPGAREPVHQTFNVSTPATDPLVAARELAFIMGRESQR